MTKSGFKVQSWVTRVKWCLWQPFCKTWYISPVSPLPYCLTHLHTYVRTYLPSTPDTNWLNSSNDTYSLHSCTEQWTTTGHQAWSHSCSSRIDNAVQISLHSIHRQTMLYIYYIMSSRQCHIWWKPIKGYTLINSVTTLFKNYFIIIITPLYKNDLYSGWGWGGGAGGAVPTKCICHSSAGKAVVCTAKQSINAVFRHFFKGK